MVRRVAVTAMGVISPLGAGAGENFTSLQAGRDAVSDVAAFDVSRCRAKTAAQIAPAFPPRDPAVHAVSEWMIRAAAEARGPGK